MNYLVETLSRYFDGIDRRAVVYTVYDFDYASDCMHYTFERDYEAELPRVRVLSAHEQEELLRISYCLYDPCTGEPLPDSSRVPVGASPRRTAASGICPISWLSFFICRPAGPGRLFYWDFHHFSSSAVLSGQPFFIDTAARFDIIYIVVFSLYSRFLTPDCGHPLWGLHREYHKKEVRFMLENNPVLDAIRSRRSIRKYTGEPIAEPVRRAILEAGFYAPSAMNRRPFHFVSITDRELMQKLSDLHPYAKMLPQADWAIIVCGDESVSGPFYMDDCAAATQNILLAAHSLGVGAVWCGVDHTERQQSFGELLGLPEHIKAYSLIVLGMPAEEKETLDRVEPDKIHENRW